MSNSTYQCYFQWETNLKKFYLRFLATSNKIFHWIFFTNSYLNFHGEILTLQTLTLMNISLFLRFISCNCVLFDLKVYEKCIFKPKP